MLWERRLLERHFDQGVLVMPGWMLMLARSKSARSAACVCAFVARRWRCPGLMVAEIYVVMGAMPLVTEVAQVMRFAAGVLGGVTVGAALRAKVGSGGAFGAAVRVVEGARGREGSRVSVQLLKLAPRGKLLCAFIPNARGRETPLELALWGSTGGGITGVCDACTVGSAAGKGGGSWVGMMSGRPVCWVKMSDN
jgi:hypothetical protein